MQAEFAHGARISILGELAASIAHEVSQPLAAVQFGSAAARRWLDRSTPDLDEARAALDRVSDSSRRATEVVSRIRSMSTNSAPQREVHSINAIVEEAIQFLLHEIRTRKITLVRELAAELPAISADRVQIQQVIVNLAMNAMQAIARGPSTGARVAVRTERDGSLVRVSVVDSGPGFSESDSEHLFESFFSTKTDGMGMGLRISRTLVEAHHGVIGARNERGGGAAFHFTLPTANEGAP